jgi:hypothetical protein
MAETKRNVALRKRQQIENAGRTMFVWVTIAAAVVGVAAVVGTSLVQRIAFNQKVINAKNETISHLKDNNKIVSDLKDNIRVLNTDPALLSTPRLDGTEPLSVILDALPSTANSSALGASLQQKLLDVSGVSLESLTVDPIAGVEDEGSSSDSEAASGQNEITFEFVVSTDAAQADNLKQVLRNIERSIRAIDLTSVTIERQGNNMTLSASGRAFYQPASTVELKEKSIKP